MAGLQASFLCPILRQKQKVLLKRKFISLCLVCRKGGKNRSRTGRRKKKRRRRMIMWGWCVWFRPIPLLRLWVSCMAPCWRSLTPPASLFPASSISSDLFSFTPYISTSSHCFHFGGNHSSQPLTSPNPLPTFLLFICCFQIFFTLPLTILPVNHPSIQWITWFLCFHLLYILQEILCFFSLSFPFDVWLASL